MTAFFICRSISHTLNDSPLQPNLNVKCRRGRSGGGAYLTLLSELYMRIVGNKVDKILQNHHLISFYGCKFPGIINPVRQEAGFLTTDFEVLWTAKILIPIENLMHFTSPLSSILWKQYSFKHDRDTLKLWMSYLVPEGNTAFVIRALHHDTRGSPRTHRKHLQAIYINSHPVKK